MNCQRPPKHLRSIALTSYRQRSISFAVLILVAGSLSTSELAKADVFSWSYGTASGKVGQIKSISDRRSADGLLKRAREALTEGNVELAEWYVDRVEKSGIDYSAKMFQRFVDTPAKVRESIVETKNRMQRSGNNVATQVVPPSVPAQSAVATAQPTIPAGVPATGSAGSTNLEAAVTGQATRAAAMLERSRTALALGNTSEAVAWYHSAVKLNAHFSPDAFNPGRLRDELLAAGVSENLLATGTPAAVGHHSITDPAQLAQLGSQLPSVLETPEASYVSNEGDLLSPEDVTSSSLLRRAEMIKSAQTADNGPDPATTQARNSALQLMAEARASLDRGDLEMAEQFARAAQELAVPDDAYEPSDPRPWMVLAAINKRQEGIHPAAMAASAVNNQPFAAPPVNTAAISSVNSAPAVMPELTPSALPVVQFPSTETSIGNNPPNQVGTAQTTSPQVGQLQEDKTQIITMDDLPAMRATGTAPPPFDRTRVELAQATSDKLAPVTSFGAGGEDIATTISDLVAPKESNTPPATSYETVPAEARQQLSPPPPGRLAAAQPNLSPEEEARANDAVRLFNAGQEALSEQELDKARKLFKEAWKFEADLPPDVRQALQDNLQMTRASSAERRNGVRSGGMSELQRASVDKLLAEVSREQAIVRREKQENPFKAWERLKALRATVAAADVDIASRQQLLARVNGQLKQMEQYVDQNRAKFENDQRNKRVLDEIDRERALRVRNQEQLAEMVEEFNDLMDQQRFPEAVVIAKKARELDPLDPVVQTMLWRSQVARQIVTNMIRNEQFNEGSMNMLNDAEFAGTPNVGDNSLVFPDATQWGDLTDRRRKAMEANRRRYTEVEVEIQRALKNSVDVKFEDVPLAYVIDELATMVGINAFIDPEGLAAEGVTSDTPVTLSLRKPVSLRSALNLILQPLHLSFIIQDEVLRITSEQVRDGDVRSEVYHVADLVIPIPNFVPGNNMGLPGAIREAHNVLGQGYMGGAMRTGGLTMMADNPGVGTNSTSASVLAQMGASGMVPSAGTNGGPYGMGTGSSGGGSQADFDTLIELITTTIDPDTWEDVGGQGTIAGFPTNLSLVVQQTQEVHNKIADLLAQLRRLQDLQVTIEVRFITLNDNFFERIGVDFDFDIDDNTGLNVTQLNDLDDSGPSVTVGLDPNGAPTVDLDIGFTQGSFGATTPTFGGFDANSAANLGFAILSDIEAFFVIQAAQGDSRTNILQAPKVTLFNGQTAFVSDTANRPFVTSVIPVVGDFAAAHQPVITVLTEGTSLTVQAVVSQDRRFVRLTLVPFFSQIGDVDTFTFEGATTSDTGTTAVDPTDDTQSVRNNSLDARRGTTVQLPTFAFTTVSTTVSVPDGGTILLGGIKRLSEGRTEQGVPMLSKLPYINRLFKNVGIGRDTSSLMMMVTPRIIIQEEEEEKLGIATP